MGVLHDKKDCVHNLFINPSYIILIYYYNIRSSKFLCLGEVWDDIFRYKVEISKWNSSFLVVID